jgi:hypothetical protein
MALLGSLGSGPSIEHPIIVPTTLSVRASTIGS